MYRDQYGRRAPNAPGPQYYDRDYDDMDDGRGIGAHVPWLAVAAGAALGAAGLAYVYSRRDRDYGIRDDAPVLAGRGRTDSGRMALVGNSVTINRPRSEIYGFWKDTTNLPKFMDNVHDVRLEGDVQVWTIAAPMGREVTLRTRIVEDVANERLSWRSVEGSDIETRGNIQFKDAPADRGTIVSAHIAYDPPGGDLGRLIAKLFRREPAMQGRHELKRLKMLLETGEIATNHNRRSDETRSTSARPATQS